MQDIINHIKKAVLAISKELKFPDTSYSSAHNQSGDTQLKLDIKSDILITEILRQSPKIKALISEEKESALSLNKDAEYIIAYDPLDGSSLVDVNFAVGSIFAVYEKEAKANNLKAAVYSIYGPRLELVVCKRFLGENGENEAQIPSENLDTKPKLYRLNENEEFEFIKDLSLQEKGKINATGGTQKNWSKAHKAFVESLFEEGYRLRYSGAMVSDLHQILCKGGGLFSYPATSDAPQGKLRVLFEILPFALIFESANGATDDGKGGSLLSLNPASLHATSPCFFGSKYEISKLSSFKDAL